MASKKKFDTSNIIVVKELRDYSNDPYLKKKEEDVRAFLKKNGFPKSVDKKKNK
jgi:hypothetical protein